MGSISALREQLETLFKDYDQADSKARSALLKRLHEYKEPQIIPILIEKIAPHVLSGRLLREVIKLIGDFGEVAEEAVPALLWHLTPPDLMVQGFRNIDTTYDALLRIGPCIVPALVDAFHALDAETSKAEQIRIVKLLGEFRDARVLGMLESALASEKRSLIEACAEAIQRIDLPLETARIIAAHRAIVETPGSNKEKQHSIQVLEAFGRTSQRPLEQLASGCMFLQRGMLEGLTPNTESEVWVSVLEWLAQKSQDLPTEGLRAIRRCLPREALSFLHQSLFSDSPEPIWWMREWTFAVLLKMGASSSLDLLKEHWKFTDKAYSRGMISFSERWGGAAEVTWLLEQPRNWLPWGEKVIEMVKRLVRRRLVNNARILLLREVLLQPPSLEIWCVLCGLFSGWPDNDQKQLALDYASSHLEPWPDELRIAPVSWWFEQTSGKPLLEWRIVRAIEIDQSKMSVFHSATKESIFLPESQQRFGHPCMQQITHLTLRRMALKPQEIRILCETSSLEQLRRLDVSENQLAIRGARWLARCDKFPHLEYLNVSGNGIDSIGEKWLMDSPFLSGVTIQMARH